MSCSCIKLVIESPTSPSAFSETLFPTWKYRSPSTPSITHKPCHALPSQHVVNLPHHLTPQSKTNSLSPCLLTIIHPSLTTRSSVNRHFVRCEFEISKARSIPPTFRRQQTRCRHFETANPSSSLLSNTCLFVGLCTCICYCRSGSFRRESIVLGTRA